ncbi:MAG: cyclic lactone autoinducer peptide [Eubacterium sp.]
MLNKFMNNLAKHFASLALIVGVISTSQSCHFFLNQPEVPDEMKKLVKKRK